LLASRKNIEEKPDRFSWSFLAAFFAVSAVLVCGADDSLLPHATASAADENGLLGAHHVAEVAN
jgi:hypothetical protein